MIYRLTLIRRDRVPPYKESLEYVVSEECDMNLLISVECTKDRKTFSMRLKWLRKWKRVFKVTDPVIDKNVLSRLITCL